MPCLDLEHIISSASKYSADIASVLDPIRSVSTRSLGQWPRLVTSGGNSVLTYILSVGEIFVQIRTMHMNTFHSTA